MTARLGLRLWLRLLACSFLLSATATVAAATSVTPVHVEMTSAGRGSRTQVTVTNTGSVPLPVEASLQKLRIGDTGERRFGNAGDQFLVFPPQAMIPAGGVQVFRVQWVGDPLLKASETYLLSISQIPVKQSKGATGIQLAASFGVVINVAPPQGEPKLRLVETRVARDDDGTLRPVITVENPTNVHALLPQSTIRLSAGNWSETLTPPVLGQRLGIGVVQPGARRKFVLPAEVPANVSSLNVSLDFKPKKRRGG